MDWSVAFDLFLGSLVIVAAFFAVAAWLVARSKGPTAWARRVQEVELAVAELDARVTNVAESLAKWRGREAARLARAGREVSAVDDSDAEPDPVRNPAAWKEWVNSGGIRMLKGRRR